MKRPFHVTRFSIERCDATVAVLAAPEGANYYHWMFDVLPRLHLLEKWRGAIDLYALPRAASSVQKKSLAELGVGAEQILELTSQQRLRCRRILLPSLPGSEGNYPPWSIEYLRRELLPRSSGIAGAGPLVYLARGEVAARSPVNERALIAALSEIGYAIVFAEKYSFLEQVAIFRDAKVVVAPHGAGLANIVFSTDLKLVELFAREYVRFDCFYTLSQVLGFSYQYRIFPSGASAGLNWGQSIVDVEEVRSVSRNLAKTL